MHKLAALTAVFSVDLGEPQFVFDARWRKNQQGAMNINGSSDLLLPMIFTQTDFSEWLAENYETDVDHDGVQSVFDGQPLSGQQMLALNPSSAIHAIRGAVHDTGYPIENGG